MVLADIGCSLCHFGRGSQLTNEGDDGWCLGCSLCHFGRGSQQTVGASHPSFPAVRSAISAEVHSDRSRSRESCLAVRSAISAEVHSLHGSAGLRSIAVRSAISAEVHSFVKSHRPTGSLLFALPFRQRFTASPTARSTPDALFALPFRQRFTAPLRGAGPALHAVRSAISAEVHSFLSTQ